MSGQGKYTTFAPLETSEKTKLLGKLFPSDLAGKKHEEVRDMMVEIAKINLQPEVQKGADPLLFNEGKVNLAFGGAPDLTTSDQVGQAGGPANPYMPDISSPGEGKTEGTDKPGMKIDPSEVKPNLVTGVGGTKSPSTTSSKIVAANVLNNTKDTLPDGDSGANG